MDRFSINNGFKKVSYAQFMETAERLESALKEVRPQITSKLLLTTDLVDYNGHGSLTIETPESKEASDRRESYQLNELNEELWDISCETGLYIKDNSSDDPYMVCLTVEDREPKKRFFYGQSLDEKSQKVLDSFKQADLFQTIGDGYPKSSDFAVTYSGVVADFKKSISSFF